MFARVFLGLLWFAFVFALVSLIFCEDVLGVACVCLDVFWCARAWVYFVLGQLESGFVLVCFCFDVRLIVCLLVVACDFCLAFVWFVLIFYLGLLDFSLGVLGFAYGCFDFSLGLLAYLLGGCL